MPNTTASTTVVVNAMPFCENDIFNKVVEMINAEFRMMMLKWSV